MSKIQKAFEKNKKYLILFLVLWVVLEIVLIAPMSVAIAESTSAQGQFELANFIENFGKEVSSFTAITRIGSAGAGSAFGKGTLWLTILCLVVTAIGIIKSKPNSPYVDIENGSSDWCEGGEQYKILSKNKGIILAEDNYLPVDKIGNVNVLVVGGSGSGKSASYSIPNAYQMLGSYVFTDPKGELYDKTAGYLKANGYDIKVLNLVNPENSDGYNPLMHIQSEIDVDVIANTIIKGQDSDGKGSDPFWDNNAEMLLKSLIYYLLEKRPKEEINLTSCAEMVRAAASSNGTNLLRELMSELPLSHPARTNFQSVEVVAGSEKTYSSILSTLQSKLGKFDSQEIANVTSTNTINFEDIANHKTAVYVISSDTHTAYNFLLTIFFAQMIQQLYNYADMNGGRLKVPTYFILDEFANIGQIPDFDKKISTSRSRGISFSVILQNLDQLEAVYEKSYETIMGNCDTHVFLGSNSFKTVEYFSKQLGETTIVRDTKSTNRDKNFSKQGYSTSDQIMGRALMTPDELRRMDNDLCIIFEKGLKPIKANKYYYFTKPTMNRRLNQERLDHNNFDAGVRGEWRKFNPQNPYADSTDKPEQDLKVESLDDLFEDDVKPITPPTPQAQPKASENVKKQEEAPVLPMEDNTREDELFSKDLQEELEAKFDELFGSVDTSKKDN
ncbi:MAG: type IV secretory system conjugative DNA transfer family protein [Clostridium sp.]|jgi:type IV secretion system protein VirD4|nr:type IV secretory system conjugative DNA transfer family protein [Clostridium sp.]